ncbi:MAG TPA: sensor histidine kinase [Candidatus Dormibacteraeota bacterium]|nr:sensor histidine kinase [Candidatus Dormibacteraeota bacterium]
MSDQATHSHAGYRHDALLYAGTDEFVDRTARFVRGGVSAGEPVMVATSAQKIERLRCELGQEAQHVVFADMAQVGANPARIIPFWQNFVDKSAASGRPFRGIGEPIWAGRSAAELVECQRHESLLNVALSKETPMWLLCPYDTEALEPEVINEAMRSHPFLTEGTTRRESGVFRGISASAAPFEAPLAPPPSGCHAFEFGMGAITNVREIVAASAYAAGLGTGRAADLVQAAHEVAVNSVRHGGGRGVLRVWRDAGALICEVTDQGRINEPLVDRQRPDGRAATRRGLWLANQLCDLVQIRSLPSGSVVRLVMNA